MIFTHKVTINISLPQLFEQLSYIELTFFKTYKLNRAAQLLAEGKYTVSEVADMTGFSTASHFSTSFKKQFGIAPSDYPGS